MWSNNDDDDDWASDWWGLDTIRLVVLRPLLRTPNNAPDLDVWQVWYQMYFLRRIKIWVNPVMWSSLIERFQLFRLEPTPVDLRVQHIIIIIIMSLTPVSSSYEDIRGVPSMQSCYSAGMKQCGICMEERSPLWVRRSKSEETLCRLLITMVEETFDIRRSRVDHGIIIIIIIIKLLD